MRPGSPAYGFSTHKCDPRIPEYLPEHTPAIGDDGTIYVGGAKGLFALNPDGSQKWFYELQENGFDFQLRHRPVLYPFLDDEDHIWFDFKTSYEIGTGGLHRVDATGEGKPFISGVHQVTQAGLLQDGTIFVLWDDTSPAFLSPNGVQQPRPGTVPNGQTWWDAQVGIPQHCFPPAFGSDGLRYVACKDRLLVLKPSGDLVVWSFPVQGWAAQPAIAEDGTVYFGAADHNFYALGADGELKWKFSTGDKVRSTPAIAKDGTVFFGSDDHHLYALDSAGKVRWKFEAGGAVYSPTIAPDGAIYALSADGKLYALRDLEANGGLWGQWPKFAGDIRNDWRGPAPRKAPDSGAAK